MAPTHGAGFLQHSNNGGFAVAPEGKVHKPAFFDEPLQAANNAGVTALRGHSTYEEKLVREDADNQASEGVLIVGALWETIIPNQQWNGPLRQFQRAVMGIRTTRRHTYFAARVLG